MAGEYSVQGIRLRRDNEALADEIFVNFTGVILLAGEQIAGELDQPRVLRVEAEAENIDDLTTPRGAEFSGDQNRHLMLMGKLLERFDGIDSIMIGDRRQPKPFAGEMTDKCFWLPLTVAVGGMGL